MMINPAAATNPARLCSGNPKKTTATVEASYWAAAQILCCTLGGWLAGHHRVGFVRGTKIRDRVRKKGLRNAHPMQTRLFFFVKILDVSVIQLNMREWR